MEFDLELGTALVKYARQNIEYYLEHREKMPVPAEIKEKFGDKYGAFVTLMKYHGPDEKSLRGCIGYTQPLFPLFKAVHDVSLSSALEDPRFPKVTLDEMSKICVEVSVLTPPEKIEVEKPEEYLEKIKVGRDGLVVKRGARAGLLLPQVPVEQGRNWDVLTFIQHTCQKAWLPPDAWKDLKHTTIESFQAIVFEEESPNGPVRRKELPE
ncbi:MAG: TIGR00296 family protein [Promethearchaeota archaeon]